MPTHLLPLFFSNNLWIHLWLTPGAFPMKHLKLPIAGSPTYNHSFWFMNPATFEARSHIQPQIFKMLTTIQVPFICQALCNVELYLLGCQPNINRQVSWCHNEKIADLESATFRFPKCFLVNFAVCYAMKVILGRCRATSSTCYGSSKLCPSQLLLALASECHLICIQSDIYIC